MYPFPMCSSSPGDLPASGDPDRKIRDGGTVGRKAKGKSFSCVVSVDSLSWD